MSNVIQPSDLELQVLAVLWRGESQSVRQLQESIPDQKKRAYTTVLSVLQVMERKGLVDHDKVGNVYVYRPLVTRRQVLGPMFRSMVNNIFGGRPCEAMAQLIEDEAMSEADLLEIRSLLDDKTPTDNKSDGEST